MNFNNYDEFLLIILISFKYLLFVLSQDLKDYYDE